MTVELILIKFDSGELHCNLSTLRSCFK